MNPLFKEEGLARTSEPSEPAKTLQHPELNPLQNPLLSENMNRWAEVYFNNPPERRDAAVVELLEELIEEKRQRDEQYRKPNPTFIPQSRELVPTPSGRENIVHCRACRTPNPATHQFCGNCGQSLEVEEPREREDAVREADRRVQRLTEPTHTEPLRAAQQSPAPEFQEELANDSFREFAEASEDPADVSPREYDPRSYPPASSNDLSLFQNFRTSTEEEEEDWEYGPQPSSSYRHYIAVVLTILILGLGYLAWRSAQSSQASRDGSPLPTSPAAENAPAAAGANPSGPNAKEISNQPAAPKNTPSPAAEDTPSTSGISGAQQGDHGQPGSAMTKASDREPIATRVASPAPAHSAPGAEELATAQRYLSGAAGQARDSNEAAKWLWKAISKQNGQATLMLADLYLRGDGVAKSCEQGRVLLDSAAQRGIAGAAERLRNLQAFGCQ